MSLNLTSEGNQCEREEQGEVCGWPVELRGNFMCQLQAAKLWCLLYVYWRELFGSCFVNCILTLRRDLGSSPFVCFMSF